ncbi:Crp/Fnr family transcriptional regulator [Oleispirillum naphthae]|uniref:Crp/Fnr family transcriptional regulator n=1 Tax=Oleispirillum naphthae TaxID=2838853 RepID=UPI003082269D
MTPGEDAWCAAACGAARQRRLKAGQTLFRQGSPVFGVFALAEGRIRLVRYAPGGAACILHVARRGETFAEAALFSPTYRCDAVAETACRVTVLPKRALLAAFAADPAAAMAFMARLAGQVQDLRAQLELRNLRSAAERVMQYLALLSQPERETIVFDRPFKDVAAEIGLTHESFYRTLAALAAKGAIVRRGREIRLLPGRDG